MAQTVGVVGGTGPAGRGVALRLASAGHEVWLGSRDESRADECARLLTPRGDGVIRGVSNSGAASAALVIIATPWDSAVATARTLRKELDHKIVISMVNALTREGKEVLPLVPARGSMAAQLAFALPQSSVVGAFHHLPAALMEDLDSGLGADVAIFGDDPDARTVVVNLVDSLEGLRAIEVGSLSLAGAVEAFTAVCASINIRHRAHSYLTISGLSL